MNIEEARGLKSGDKVKTDKGYNVQVKQPLSLSKTTKVHTSTSGVEYLWVGTSMGVWPSNRLEKI